MGNEVTTTLVGNDHLTAQQFAAWPSAASSEAASLIPAHAALDDHMHTCAACRAQLVMLQQATQLAPELEASPEFDSLLRLGEQAALSAVREASQPARAVVQPATTQLGWRVWLNWRVALPLAAMLLLAVGIPAYFYYQRNQPIERAMASLRQSWTQSRPLEARVTGGFNYLPYRVTRGSNDAAPVNQNQLIAATAELARELADRPTPKAQHYMGRVHLLKGEFARAEELLNEVIKADPQNASAHVDLGIAIYERGIRERGNGEQYITTLTKAAEHLTKSIELSPQMLEAWFNLALCQEQLMQFLQAKATWGKYLQLDTSSFWAQEARARLQQLQEKTTLEKNLDKVEAELKAAYEANDSTKLHDLLNNYFSEIAVLLYGPLVDEYIAAAVNNDQLGAQKTMQLLLSLSDLVKEDKGDYFFSDLVGTVHRATPARLKDIAAIRNLLKQGDNEDRQDKALNYFMAARQSSIQITDVFHQELATIKLSGIILSKNVETVEFAKAREWLLAETEKRQHKLLRSKALIWSANIYISDQRFVQTLAVCKEAFEISRHLKDRVLSANSLSFIARVNSELGNHQSAIQKDTEAIDELLQYPPSAFRATQVFNSIAETLEKSGNFNAAFDYQVETLAYSEKTNRSELVIMSLGRASAYLSQLGRHEDATGYLNQAITRIESYQDSVGKATLAPDLYYSLGSSLLKQGQIASAEAAFRQVLAELGNKQFYKQAAVRQGLALAYLRQGKVEQAEQELLQGIRLTEQSQQDLTELNTRNSFFASRLDIYHTMIGLQYAQRKSNERAFDYAEASRSRELSALLSGSVKFQPDQVEAFLQYSRRIPSLTLKELQRSLPPQAQLIEYALLEDQLMIWVISSEQVETVSVEITAASLQQLVSDYLSLLSMRQEVNRLNVLGGQLHGHLIAPIAKYLRPQSVLVIIPDGALQALPFTALYDRASGHYLVQDFALSSNPSAKVYIQMLKLSKTKKQSRAESLLTLSNPRFSSLAFPDLKPIPRTEAEATSIQAYYPVHTSLNQNNATRAKLLKNIESYEVVHFATHSVVNPQNPLLSTIVLTEDDEPVHAAVAQGFGLQAREIFGLNLSSTRLIVLSSCQSALNTSLGGNGIGSLAHAFFSAKVPTVIASLWNVDDDSTAELMKEFHRSYRVEQRSFSAALQQAQVKLLFSSNQRWQHPYYWAAFLVAGNGIST